MYQTTYTSPLGVFHASFHKSGRVWIAWLYQDGKKVWGADNWRSKREARDEIDLMAKRWHCTVAGHRRIY